jgi:hypothetical protein
MNGANVVSRIFLIARTNMILRPLTLVGILAVTACGARVSPGTDAGSEAAAAGDAGPSDWPRVQCFSGPTDEGGYVNDPRDPTTCACWGAVPPNRSGLCLWDDYPRDRAADFVCAIPGAATIALIPTSMPADAGPAPWGRGGCIPVSICAELERTGQPRQTIANWTCVYPDQSRVVTGVLPPAVGCSAATHGVLCGPGCAACGQGDACWGGSERNALGVCASTTQLRPCRSATDCGADACLVIADMVDIPGHPAGAYGRCVPRDRCAAAARGSSRFRCL